MSDFPGARSSERDELAEQIEQSVRGDRNQTIGQVLGGMVFVYIKGYWHFRKRMASAASRAKKKT